MLYGTPTELEIDFAKLRDAIPSLEKIRLLIQVQKLLTTIRVARAYTKRNKIIRGSYHGHSDLVLVAAGVALHN